MKLSKLFIIFAIVLFACNTDLRAQTTQPSQQTTKADFDSDGDVDMDDYAAFSICVNGSNHPPKPCSVNADFDQDGDVDINDFATFQTCYNGANRPPSLDCRAMIVTGTWKPPIGIPEPSFGIKERNTDFKGKTYIFSGSSKVYPNGTEGPYTHYVDASAANATDSNNTYGTPEKPRKTIPTYTLPAGSIVEVHSGTYGVGIKDITVKSAGTAEAPVFLRGVANKGGTRPKIISGLRPEGKYWIIENIELDGTDTGNGRIRIIDPHSFIVIRDCEIHHSPNSEGIQIVSSYAQSVIEGIVIINNKIHDCGDWLAAADEDKHGVVCNILKTGCSIKNIWVLDNEMYRCSGNGIQINAFYPERQKDLNHIYIGRNNFHHNKQRGAGIKQSQDVILSQNKSYACHPVGENPSNPGDGLGCNYGPENIWFIYNEVFDCDNGIRYSGGGSGLGKNIYIVGNVIYGIRHSTMDVTGEFPVKYDPDDAFAPGAAVAIWNYTGNKWIVNNTIVDCDAGIYATYTSENPLLMYNNLFAKIGNDTGKTYSVRIEPGLTAKVSIFSNNLIDASGRIQWNGQRFYDDVASFEEAVPISAQGNVQGDPVFVNTGDKNFRLSSGSKGIDVGTQEIVLKEVYAKFKDLYGLDIQVDFGGKKRPVNKMDAGAFEK